MHTGPAPRPLAFTSRNQYLGTAASHAANQPRELPTTESRPVLASRLALLALRLLFILLVVLVLAITFFLIGQQWRSGTDAGPEAHEASVPSRPYAWTNESE
ncbi:hypothetical protein QMK33_19865 [Hymenobacter sp. H14-R3]|uniref:hypothetical protein n=1 Tax=Hymenobacter sp. H14-R3 TaxID=3046308 RepID=UPI0024B89C44|nr:hypothetical protein [Hymenobacter sp. H14-R3]MDJ0367411.1 hypothetical protein [Hymenobacter sp. H14-R3]